MPGTMEKIVAVIPARGGSKGVPRKNLRKVGGKPLIAWSIQCASASTLLDRTIVSTDDEEIADIARELGAQVPFIRPSELAADKTPGIAPMIHALRWLEEYEGYLPDALMCLQPTSPLRLGTDVDDAIKLARKRDALGVVSVTEARVHPFWLKRMDDQGRLDAFCKDTPDVARRQDLPKAWALNGAIFLADREMLLRQGSWYGPRTYALKMPHERSLDVDSLWDLQLVDLLLRNRDKNAKD